MTADKNDLDAKQERIKQNNASYYAQHRDEIIERSKQYYAAHKDALRPKRRGYEKTYRKRHAEHVRQRKQNWDAKNLQAQVTYAAARYKQCAEMTQRAKFICPVFQFLTQVRHESVATYTLAYRQNERVVPKAAKKCDALRVMDARLCPLVVHDITDAEQMAANCPMNRAFLISGAGAEIARRIKQMNESQK